MKQVRPSGDATADTKLDCRNFSAVNKQTVHTKKKVHWGFKPTEKLF